MKAEKKRKNVPMGLYWGIYFAMIYSFSQAASQSVFVPFSSGMKVLLILGIGLFVGLSIKKPLFFIVSGILAGISFSIINHFKREWIVKGIHGIAQGIENIVDFLHGKEQILTKNGSFVWILTVILIAIYTFFILFRTNKIWLLVPVYLGVMGYLWYIYIDVAYWWILVFLLSFFILFSGEVYLTKKESFSEKGTESNGIYHTWIKMAFAYSLLILIFSNVVPFHGRVIRLKEISTFLTEQFPKLKELRQEAIYGRSFAYAGEFEFSKTGFQTDQSRLGGPAVLDDEIAFYVMAEEPFYLRGNVKAVYQGNNWYSVKEELKSCEEYRKLQREVPLGKMVFLEIQNENMATNTIFTPYQPLQVISERYDSFYYRTDYQLEFPKGVYKGEGYQVKAYIPTPQGTTNAILPKDKLLPWYLEVSEMISPELYVLAHKLTQDRDSDYEKALAIQEYLREEYTYRLDVPFPPSNKKFVEYFLLESKEGYCTYYATAMAVLLRLNDIPSRYIEGFRMTKETKEDRYVVRKKDAHAWVEAYIEPYGWLRFEPTPIYDAPEPIEETGKETSYSLFMEEEALLFLGKDRNREREFIDLEEGMGEIKEKETLTLWQSSIIWAKKNIFVILLVLMMGGFSVRVLYVRFRYKKYVETLKKLPKEAKVVRAYLNGLELLGHMGYGLEKGETLREYALRVSPQMYHEKYSLIRVTGYFEEVFYGEIAIQEEQAEEVMAFFLWTLHRTKYMMGKKKYFWKAYILFRLYTIGEFREGSFKYCS